MYRHYFSIAEKKQREKEKVIGKDIQRFTQKKKMHRCRSDETRISLSKAVPLLRSFDSDRTSDGTKISFNKEDIK